MAFAVFDPRTGRFIQSRPAEETASDIHHEINMRCLGAEPDLYPGKSMDALEKDLEFYRTIAAIERAGQRQMDSASVEISYLPETTDYL